ncbi:hypothetical protein [Chitinimonas koreensis]|uniref:hypothetical protein n=1 Tax=Chitinimonas koreensis TaxID=356302 RepID=UPI00048F1BCB|nr:hypothetical protein [Chitinimonas koreensis]QNM95452.1 hypothetical protein H9L41_16485 [Chitinimonas koreensis]
MSTALVLSAAWYIWPNYDAEDARATANAGHAEEALRSHIKTADRLADSYAAFQSLSASEARVLSLYDPCYDTMDGKVCKAVKVQDEIRVRRLQYLDKAAAQHSRDALLFLFVVGHDEGDGDHSTLRTKHVKTLFDYLDSAPNAELDGPLLMKAGELALAGTATMRDVRRAIGFYARAWALGTDGAAQAAAAAFVKIRDTPNAYLWALRCTGNCQRDSWTALDQLEKDLSLDEIQQVQKLAPVVSVIEVSSSGA